MEKDNITYGEAWERIVACQDKLLNEIYLLLDVSSDSDVADYFKAELNYIFDIIRQVRGNNYEKRNTIICSPIKNLNGQRRYNI